MYILSLDIIRVTFFYLRCESAGSRGRFCSSLGGDEILGRTEVSAGRQVLQTICAFRSCSSISPIDTYLKEEVHIRAEARNGRSIRKQEGEYVIITIRTSVQVPIHKLRQ